jgi:hypothetical protein
MVKAGLPAASSGTTEEHRRELEAAITDVAASRILVALRAFGEADLKLDPNSTLPLDIALADCILEVPQPSSPFAGQPQPAPAATRPAASSPAPRPTASAPSKSARPESLESRQNSEGGTERTGTNTDVPSADEQGGTAFPPDPGYTQPAAAGDGGLVAASLPDLRQNMRTIYHKARERSPALGALLNSGCDIIKADDQEVQIGFKWPNLAQRASDKANLEALRTILREVTGNEMTVSCIHVEDVSDWKQREPSTRSALVRAAQEMGARVLTPAAEEQA